MTSGGPALYDSRRRPGGKVGQGYQGNRVSQPQNLEAVLRARFAAESLGMSGYGEHSMARSRSGYRRQPILVLLIAVVGWVATAQGQQVTSRGKATRESNAPPKRQIRPDGDRPNVGATRAGEAVQAAGKHAGAERVLHFPKDRSLGSLYVQDTSVVRRINTFSYWTECNDEWQYLGQAMSDVEVPAGKRLHLEIRRSAGTDLSPLSKLCPDDLYRLSIFAPADDKCAQHLKHLTGLRELSLESTSVGEQGIRSLLGIKSLERLTLPKGCTDAGLAEVAELRSLRGLYIRENRITNKGVAHLTKLSNLEELSIGGGYRDEVGTVHKSRINDAALVHLAKLGSLRYLMLNDGFTDAGLEYLKNIPSLRILNLGHRPITDAGMPHLAQLTWLENLGLFNTKVTDKGLVHLKAMGSLKKLDLNKRDFDRKNPPITDAGMVHLKEIKSLEYLALPPTGITDAGLVHLAELDCLKYLWVGTHSAGEISDTGLKHLSRLQSLEELYIGGQTFSAEGFSAIAGLPRLRKLSVATNTLAPGSLASLAKLRSLETLNLRRARIGLSELNRFSGLPEVRSLNIALLVRDGATLNLARCPQLETLLLGMEKDAGFGDEDLASVTGLTHLKELAIGEPGGVSTVTDAGIVKLAGLTSLERLSIGGPGVSDRGLAHVATLHNLWELNITGNFTDAGVRPLEGLTHLTRLRITSGENLSSAAVARLRKALPNVSSFVVDKDRAIRAPTQATSKGLTVGDVAPSFTVETLDGKKVSLADYQGKAVLLYYWATWCKPCVASMPKLKEFQAELSKKYKGFAMISLSMDDAEARFQGFVKKHKLDHWPQARIGMSSKIAADYGVEGAPSYFLVGPDGKLASTDKDWNKIEAVVAKALTKK